MKFLCKSVVIIFSLGFICGCHTVPYGVVGAGVAAKEGWQKNSDKNYFVRGMISAGYSIAGLVSGGTNGAGNDLKFVRNQKFDYSEVTNPFNTPQDLQEKETIEDRTQEVQKEPQLSEVSQLHLINPPND